MILAPSTDQIIPTYTTPCTDYIGKAVDSVNPKHEFCLLATTSTPATYQCCFQGLYAGKEDPNINQCVGVAIGKVDMVNKAIREKNPQYPYLYIDCPIDDDPYEYNNEDAETGRCFDNSGELVFETKDKTKCLNAKPKNKALTCCWIKYVQSWNPPERVTYCMGINKNDPEVYRDFVDTELTLADPLATAGSIECSNGWKDDLNIVYTPEGKDEGKDEDEDEGKRE